MKKVLFLMLFLGTLGTVGTNAQVRIGGNGTPNGAAVLDLNATDATNNGTKGLALPRVSLSSNIAQITSGTANLSGMLVYNTNATLGVGIYYWNGSQWVKVTISPISTADIADGAITAAKINSMGATAGQVLSFQSGSWKPSTQQSLIFWRRDTVITGPMPVDTVFELAVNWIDRPAGCNGSNSWVVSSTQNSVMRTSVDYDGTVIIHAIRPLANRQYSYTIVFSCWK